MGQIWGFLISFSTFWLGELTFYSTFWLGETNVLKVILKSPRFVPFEANWPNLRPTLTSMLSSHLCPWVLVSKKPLDHPVCVTSVHCPRLSDQVFRFDADFIDKSHLLKFFKSRLANLVEWVDNLKMEI